MLGDAPAKRKVQLEPGFSLPHWMKFSKDADLSGGVGKADPEDEGSWKVWPIAEIRKHDGPEDFWSVIRGKVYNLTPYMKYHPGGIDILMKTAGNDGTVLFDKYHAWVNVEALLEACFIGIVAAKQDDSEEEATEPASSPPPSPPSPPPAEPTAAASASPKARIVWDEKNLAANDAERGVAYGTLKIDQPETPFLYGPASRPHRPPTASMAAHAARHVRCATRTDRWHPYSHSRCRYYEDGSASRGEMIPTWPSTASTSPSCGCRAVRMQKHPPLRRTARDDARWRSRSCRCCSGFSRRTRTARRSSKSPSTLPLATRSFRRDARCECEWSPALEAAQAWQARAHPYSHSQFWRCMARVYAPPSLPDQL